MKTKLIFLFLLNCYAIQKIYSQQLAVSGPLTISGTCGTCTTLPATIGITAASGASDGYVTQTTQTFAGDKTFANRLLLSAGSESAPSLAYSGNSAQNGWSFNNSNIYTSFDAMYRFYLNKAGTMGITNLPDGSFVPGLTINILHDADEEVSPQDGGVNVSTFAGSAGHTSTFGGRTANGTWDDIDPTEANQRMVEFIGKGYADGDWEPSNRGVFGVYAAQNHDATHQGAYCGIKTTRTSAQTPPVSHMSMILDAAGNAGLTYTTTGYNTSTPYGWGASEDDRFFSIESSNTSADAGLLIQNGTTTSGGTKGLNIWLDNSAKISYFDNITNDNAAYIYFRLKTLATTSLIPALSLTTTGIAMGGNANIVAAPVSALQIDKGNATASDIRWTAGTTTGITSSDGFTVGITSAGDAEIRQKENSKDLSFYERDVLTLSLLHNGNELVTGSTANPSYRTKNSDGATTTSAHMIIDPASSVTSGFAWGFDAPDGFLCTQGNGTRRIMGMAIKPMNVTSTANSEAMSMGFFTQSAGNTATEKMEITSDGRIYGTGIHNNAGTMTGTTNQYIGSGTYTPSTSNLSNVGSLSVTETQWIRVGNVVTISGRFTVTPSTATGCSFEISFPIASNIANAEDCAGVAFSGSVAGQGAEVIGVVANDTALIQWVSTNTTANSWSYTYTYEVK